MLVLAPGQTHAYHDAEWQGALVVVEQGQIELECLDGSRHRFGHGAITLAGVGCRCWPCTTAGTHAAVLVAVSRRAADAGR